MITLSNLLKAIPNEFALKRPSGYGANTSSQSYNTTSAMDLETLKVYAYNALNTLNNTPHKKPILYTHNMTATLAPTLFTDITDNIQETFKPFDYEEYEEKLTDADWEAINDEDIPSEDYIFDHFYGAFNSAMHAVIYNIMYPYVEQKGTTLNALFITTISKSVQFFNVLNKIVESANIVYNYEYRTTDIEYVKRDKQLEMALQQNKYHNIAVLTLSVDGEIRYLVYTNQHNKDLKDSLRKAVVCPKLLNMDIIPEIENAETEEQILLYLGAKLDITQFRMDELVKGLEKSIIFNNKGHIARIQTSIQNYNQDIINYTSRLNTIYRQLKDLQTDLFKAEYVVERDANKIEELKETVSLIFKNNFVEDITIENNYLKVNICAPIVYYDEAMFNKMLDTPNTNISRYNFTKSVFQYCYRDHIGEYGIVSHAQFIIDLNTMQLKRDMTTAYRNDVIAHPHAVRYHCLGSHEPIMLKQVANLDLLGFSEACVACVKNINLGDGAVMGTLSATLNDMPSKQNVIMNLETKELITREKFNEMLKETV